MKGNLVRSFILVAVISSSVVAQDVDIPVFDEEYLTLYSYSLRLSYPLNRDFNGGGARAAGMGNAFIGVSDDITAVSWNPAGLYRRENQYEQPVMSLGYKSLSADASFQDRPWDTWGRFDRSDAFKSVDFMSLLVPIRIKGHRFVGSIAYSRLGDEVYHAGMAVDTVMFYDYQDVLDNHLRPFHYRTTVDYHSWVNALNVGFGTRFYRDLSFGLAVNAYGGRASQLQWENVIWDELIIPGMPGNQRAEGMYVNNVYDTTSFTGIYFTLGLKYETEKLSAGMIVKTPHTLKETVDVLSELRAYANGIEILQGGLVIHNDNNVVELDQPLVLGTGIGYRVIDDLLLAADVEYRAFSGGKVNVRDSLRLVPGGTDVEFFTEYDPYWNDVWAFRVGGEYIWETGNRLFPTVPLRAGFGYVQIPEPDIEGSSLEIEDIGVDFVPITATAAITKWSLGAGLRWDQIHLDLAFQRASLDREDSIFAQKSSVDNSTLSFSFTGFF